jgi:hypothetical protein
LSDLSTRLVNIAPDQLDSEIEHGLRQVLEFFEVERCGLFHIWPEEGVWQVSHLAVTEDMPRVPLGVEFPVAPFSYTYDNLIHKRQVHSFSRLEDLITQVERRGVDMKRATATMPLVTLFFVTLGLILLTGTGAFAQGVGACAGDVEKFCQAVQQGGGRIAKCIAQHKEELSPGCKASLAEVGKQLKGVQKACEDDIMAFCAGVKPGGGRIAQCLKANESKLSPQCKAAADKAKK